MGNITIEIMKGIIPPHRRRGKCYYFIRRLEEIIPRPEETSLLGGRVLFNR